MIVRRTLYICPPASPTGRGFDWRGVRSSPRIGAVGDLQVHREMVLQVLGAKYTGVSVVVSHGQRFMLNEIDGPQKRLELFTSPALRLILRRAIRRRNDETSSIVFARAAGLHFFCVLSGRAA